MGAFTPPHLGPAADVVGECAALLSPPADVAAVQGRRYLPPAADVAAEELPEIWPRRAALAAAEEAAAEPAPPAGGSHMYM